MDANKMQEQIGKATILNREEAGRCVYSTGRVVITADGNAAFWRCHGQKDVS